MMGAHCSTRSELWARFIHSLAVFWPGIIPWSFSTPVPVSQPRAGGFLVDLLAVSSSSFSPSQPCWRDLLQMQQELNYRVSQSPAGQSPQIQLHTQMDTLDLPPSHPPHAQLPPGHISLSP